MMLGFQFVKPARKVIPRSTNGLINKSKPKISTIMLKIKIKYSLKMPINKIYKIKNNNQCILGGKN